MTWYTNEKQSGEETHDKKCVRVKFRDLIPTRRTPSKRREPIVNKRNFTEKIMPESKSLGKRYKEKR